MGVLSVLARGPALRGQLTTARCVNFCQRRMSGHETMIITPSRWQWHKFKDMFHFYLMLGAIPLALTSFFVNVKVGPATLTQIPEGYVPKDWEYHSHPITRFIVKYRYKNYQEMYERKLHVLHVEDEKRQMRLLETKIKKVIADREDVQGYSYRPIMTKYHRHIREEFESLRHAAGDHKG
uniref:NADH dehydrogenase [ubiquinone] 1 beta subcomplex subunit 5, mitochondrial n=2 Tax=Hirondellea gigas TaxID=1518452 RepID=A0A2P2HVP3_9CRUS